MTKISIGAQKFLLVPKNLVPIILFYNFVTKILLVTKVRKILVTKIPVTKNSVPNPILYFTTRKSEVYYFASIFQF